MDRFEGRCRLEWWANSSTLLGSAQVAVVITASEASWDARARLVSGHDREGFAVLCAVDPVFTLRFADGNTIAVTVHLDAGDDRITLTEYTGPAHRSADHQIGS